MDTPETSQNDWQDCPAGQIETMRLAVRSRARNRLLLRVGGVAGVLVVVGLSSLLMSSDAQSPQPTPVAENDTEPAQKLCGISCGEVKESAREWLAGEVPEEKARAHRRAPPGVPALSEVRRSDFGSRTISRCSSFAMSF